MIESWDELVAEYEDFLRMFYGDPPSATQYPIDSMPYRVFKNVEATLKLIPQIRDRSTFANVRMSTWHTGLHIGPVTQKARVSMWYESNENSWYVFFSGWTGLADPNSDGAQRKVTPENVIITLEHYLHRLRTDETLQ